MALLWRSDSVNGGGDGGMSRRHWKYGKRRMLKVAVTATLRRHRVMRLSGHLFYSGCDCVS